jgi:hypothetical protein
VVVSFRKQQGYLCRVSSVAGSVAEQSDSIHTGARAERTEPTTSPGPRHPMARTHRPIGVAEGFRTTIAVGRAARLDAQRRAIRPIMGRIVGTTARHRLHQLTRVARLRKKNFLLTNAGHMDREQFALAIEINCCCQIDGGVRRSWAPASPALRSTAPADRSRLYSAATNTRWRTPTRVYTEQLRASVESTERSFSHIGSRIGRPHRRQMRRQSCALRSIRHWSQSTFVCALRTNRPESRTQRGDMTEEMATAASIRRFVSSVGLLDRSRKRQFARCVRGTPKEAGSSPN